MKQNKIYRLMLAFVLTLCAWTTVSGYDLTVGTQTQCGVTFKVDNAVVTAANADDEVTIVIAPTAGYEVSTLTATAYMSTGEMQTRRRGNLVQELTVSPAVSAGTNAYTITMPAANVKVDVVCVASTQTLTFPDGLTVEDWTDPTEPTTTGWKVTDAKGNEYIVTPKAPKTGETVSITPTPAAGWQVKTPLTFDAEDPNSDVIPTDDDTDGVFTYTQPGYGGMLIVPFEKTAYTVTAAGGITGGTVNTFAAATRADGDPENPVADAFYVDDVVTMTVTPTEGMHLKSLTVSFAGQTATVTPTATATANQYQFTMLAGNATVSAEFTAYSELNTTDPAPKPLIYDAVQPGYRELGADEKPGISSVLKAQPGDATDIVIEWYYIDNNGDPITPAIGTGETYTVVEADLGKQLVYVIKQTKDADGQDLNPIRTKKSVAVEIGKGQATISYATATVEKDYTTDETAKSFTNPLTHAPATATMGLGTIAYSSNNTNVATVDADGKVTIVGAGSATITATVTDGTGWTYSGMDGYSSETNQASVSYGLTVNPAAATISYATDTETKTYGDAAFTKALTNSGDGNVTYAVTAQTPAAGSPSTSVATINATSGQVTITGAGTATITATVADGANYTYSGMTGYNTTDHTASVSYTLTVDPKTVTAAMIGNIAAQTYNYGAELTPTLTVKDGSKTMTLNTDYTVEYTNNINAAASTATPAPTATITGAGNYTGTASKTFTINKNSSSLAFTTKTINKKYDDGPFNNNNFSTEKGDGAISYRSGNTAIATVDATSGIVTIHGAGSVRIYAKKLATSNCNASSEAYFTLNVSGISLSGATFALTQTSYEYDGTAKQPGIYNVELGPNILTYGTDYYYDYSNNVNAGTAYARIYAATGSNYQGEATMSFTIRAKNVTAAMMGDIAEQTYTGEAVTPEFTVKDGSKTLVAGTDYTVGYANNTVPGNATATITGQGNYAGTASKTFTILTKALTADMIGDIAEQTYTGGPLTPELTVTNGTTPLVKGTDYTVAYANNIEPGTATATVTGQGYYTGTVTKNFTIVKNTTPDTEDEANITIGATGKSTFVSTRDVDFTNSTAKAYIAVGYDKGSNELTLSRIYKVPAGTPVMVKADNPGLFEVPFTTGATYEYLNLLVGNTSASTVEIGETAGSNTNYVLTQGEFKSVTNNAYIPTGKAYLQLTSSFPAAHAGSALTVTLTASGKSTLCSSVDLDFSAVSGMKAYVATGYDRQTKRVMLSHVQKVSAGTPLVLHGRSNTTYTIPSVAAQTTFVNMFVGNNSGAAITVYPTSGSMKNYYLGSGEFKAVVDYLTVPDGKAYLQLPASAGARSTTRSSDDDDFLMEVNDETLVIRLDGADATSVEGLLKAAAEQDVYYNLNGQRTENPGKGIYLQQGRKVVIK